MGSSPVEAILEMDRKITPIIIDNETQLRNLKNSKEESKNRIIAELQKENYEINKYVNEYYDLSNEYSLKFQEVKDLNKCKYDLENLSREFNEESHLSEKRKDEAENRLKEIARKIEQFSKNEEFKVKLLPPEDINRNKKNIIKNFCYLKNSVIKERTGIQKRKEKFIKNFKSEIYPNFQYSKSLQNSLDSELTRVLNSSLTYYDNLSSFLGEIKSQINQFLINDNSNSANNSYINLNNRVKNEIENQDKLENESLSKKKSLVISSKMKELEDLSKKIIDIKNIFDNKIIENKNEIEYINQANNNINNKKIFTAKELRNNEKNMQNLKGRIRILRNQNIDLKTESDKLDKIINYFKTLQQYNSNNNYQININTIKKIEELENIMLNKLNEINLENIENSDKSWTQNLPQMILEDSFLNKDSSDEIFNQFLEKEKTFLTRIFINNRNQ